jgi:hypothetical protein
MACFTKSRFAAEINNANQFACFDCLLGDVRFL